MLKLYFGYVSVTCVSLLMAITGGESWRHIMVPLNVISEFYGWLFLFYIFFLYLGVLNVITSMFVSQANAFVQMDSESVTHQDLMHRAYVMKELEEIYTVLAIDKDAPINLDEYLKWTENPRIRAFFQSVLNIDVFKAEQSFRLLDLNDDGSIDREEFVAGCMRVAGK